MEFANSFPSHASARPTKVLARRELLRRTGAAAIAAAFDWRSLHAFAAEASVQPALRAAAARIGVRYGSDSDVQFIDAPPEYSTLFVEQCDLLAPNLSWSTVTPKRGGSDPAREEPNVEFARQHGLKLTGFHLLWHECSPKWVDHLESSDEMGKAISAHVAAMGRHYGDRVYSWNAVNEALEPRHGRPNQLRRTPILEKMGLAAIDHTFREAQTALPKAIRVYNDYGLEMDNKEQETKRQAMLKLIDEFKRLGTPVDVIGLQSHVRLDGEKFNEKIYRQFLRDIASRGLKIFITELDVFDQDAGPDFASRDRAVGDMYERLLSAALDEPAVTAVVTWGLSDKYTWFTDQPEKWFKRPDGKVTRPLPFDDGFKPKPAYEAMLKAFANAPKR